MDAQPSQIQIPNFQGIIKIISSEKRPQRSSESEYTTISFHV